MCNTTSENNTSSTGVPKSIMKKRFSDNDLLGQYEDIEDTSAPFSSELSLEPLKDEHTETTVSSGSSLEGSAPKPKRNISFGHIEELSFAVTKGDPNFELAFPMSLAHKVAETTHDIDTYEQERNPHRRTGDALRTTPEDRKQIIKTSKKMHKRRNSIGNGEITRLSKMTDFLKSVTATSESPSTTPKAAVAKAAVAKAAVAAPSKFTGPPSPSQIRPKMRRQNSIGNGEISRLSEKSSSSNRSSFSKFFKSSKSSKKEDKKEETTTASAPQPTANVQKSQLHRAHSAGDNDAMKQSGSLTFEELQDEALRAAGQRPSLRRENSIGNGEIGKHKKRNSVQTFLKTVSKITSSNADGSKRSSWHGTNTVDFGRELPSERSVDKIDIIQAMENSIDC